MIKVLLVDDHEIVRLGIESLLNTVEGISVVGVVSCGEQALSFIEELLPDVILMDVNMPGIGGVEACRRMLLAYPEIKVIAVSAYNDGFIPEQLLKIGAKGFVSKNTSMEEMVDAIRRVMSGESYLDKDIANSLISQNSQELGNIVFSILSKRENQVVNLILQGHNIQEMAKMLNITDKAINTYRYRLYKKLNIKNNVELTQLAVTSNYMDSGLKLIDLKSKGMPITPIREKLSALPKRTGN